MEEVLRAGWAVVVIDVEGEYVRMDERTDDSRLAVLLEEKYPERLPRGIPDCRVYVPNAGMSDAPHPLPFKVPIAAVPEEIVADILEFSEAQTRMWGAVAAQAKKLADTSSKPTKMGVLSEPKPTAPSQSYTLSDLIDGLEEDSQGNIPLLGRHQSRSG